MLKTILITLFIVATLVIADRIVLAYYCREHIHSTCFGLKGKPAIPFAYLLNQEEKGYCINKWCLCFTEGKCEKSKQSKSFWAK